MKAQKRPKDMAKDDLMLSTHKTPEEKDKLSTGAGQGRKLPTS